MDSLPLAVQLAYRGIAISPDTDDTEVIEASSPPPNSGSSSSTHSESTDPTSFSNLPDSAPVLALSSVIADLGELSLVDWVFPPADYEPTHDRSHYQSHDQRNPQRAHLDCNICYNAPTTHPVATHCGHLFCSPCLNQWLQDGSKPCPVCRTIVKAGINTVRIYCSTSGPSDGNSRAFNSTRPNPPISTPGVPTHTETQSDSQRHRDSAGDSG